MQDDPAKAKWRARAALTAEMSLMTSSSPISLPAASCSGSAATRPRRGKVDFDEVSCRAGEIGTIPAKELLPLAMAHAGKLEKFGA